MSELEVLLTECKKILAENNWRGDLQEEIDSAILDINNIKAEAVREAFKDILTECCSFWSSDIGDTIVRYDDIKERMDEVVNELERGDV